MAVMTKDQAKKFVEMDDKMIDVLDYLKAKDVIDAKTHRSILLTGYANLVECLRQKKLVSAKEAKEAVKGGFNYLLPKLTK